MTSVSGTTMPLSSVLSPVSLAACTRVDSLFSPLFIPHLSLSLHSDHLQLKLLHGKVCKISNFGAIGDGSDKSNIGNVGKISNFGAVGDSSDKSNIGKVGKISNFGAIGNGNDKSNIDKVG